MSGVLSRALALHPEFRCAAVAAIAAEVRRPRPGFLSLRWTASGVTDDLVLPPPAPPSRADELWRRTCFEVFVRSGPGGAYFEFNLAPSTEWAAWRFDGYRQGMAPADLRQPPQIETRSTGAGFELFAELDLDGIAGLAAGGPWRLGVSAVIEARAGVSYWALAHPPGRPDFHHADCFALELPAPDRP